MKVPLRLSRRPATAPADAVLLVAPEVAALARAVARFPAEALPRVFRVRGGFLLVFANVGELAVPGLRLRRLAGDFFVPVDAVPNPALLPDELVALTRDRGLVLLPGGEAMAFDASRPLAPADWLGAHARRDSWEPFPPRPDRPDRLTSIERPSPPAAVAEVLAEGAPPGTEPLPGAGAAGDPPDVPEEARPPRSSALSHLSGAAKLGLARALAFLGRVGGSNKLMRAAGDLARKAAQKVPRLSENLFGEQEAALREVLRQLQSGDVENGLRRAPVAVPDPDQPSRIDTGSRLADRDPRYSLRDLMGGGGAGAGWLGGGDVWLALANEYRRLAREAAQRGDFRRAAYLHGVLLRDVRSAANVLAAGGLHRDAAVLLRDRVTDLAGAAREFERAGDFDEALRLYELLEQFETAGDLLRRIGDDDRAAEYYGRAADRLAAQGRHLAAGDLIRQKAGDLAAARGYYRSGWVATTAESIPCAERLIDEFYLGEDWPAADELFAEAEGRLAASGAGRLFNYALHVGQDFLPAARREDLADRVRLLFGRHLRDEALGRRDASRTAGELFPSDRAWPAAVCRDAAVAARLEGRRAAVIPATDVPVRLADGTTVGVVAARDTRAIIVATTTAVVCWRPDEDRLIPVCHARGRQVAGLSADPYGRIVYVLFVDGFRAQLECFAAKDANTYQPAGQYTLGWAMPRGPECYLQPAAVFRYGDIRVTLTKNKERHTLLGINLQPVPTSEFAPSAGETYLLADAGSEVWDWDVGFLRCSGPTARWCRWMTDWSPAIPEGSSLTVPPLDWIRPVPRKLEVTGTDRDGTLYWSQFDAREPHDLQKQTAAATHPAGYVASCMEGPGLVVAATGSNEIHWLRVSGTTLQPWRPVRKLALPARVASLVRTTADSVVAVLQDGTAIRVSRPTV